MLNVKSSQNEHVDRSDEQPGRPAGDRPVLERELLDEMTNWSPKDRGGVFKNWHRHALSLVHLNVLTELEAEGPLSMRRLAEAMDVSDASATGIVDRMEKRGLVERRHGVDDRRVVLVHPTDAGRQVFTSIAAHRREGLSQILAELTAVEIAGLLVGMRAIHAARNRVFLAQAGAADSADPAANAADPAANVVDRASSITRSPTE
jgi:DNA-binding MarR family transcriptional regulator